LLARVGPWGPARWAAANRADSVFALVQALADLLAEAEHRPSRPVPRLDNDLALPDQLRVMVNDLLAAPVPPPVLQAATTRITTTPL
jgi:hypothetical protein